MEDGAPRPAVLETERLVLRPWHVDDAAVRRRLWTERDPRVPAHRRIGADGRPTAADLAEQIRQSTPGDGLGLLAVVRREPGDVIGYCGLIENAYGMDGEPELAFELLRATWGQGYATEASWAVIEWAQATGVRRLWATVREWNAPSRRVLAKLGFDETDRIDRDPVHGDSLFTTKAL